MKTHLVVLVVLIVALASVAFAEGTVTSETDPPIDYTAATPSGGTSLSIELVGFGGVNYTAGDASFAEAGCAGFIQDRIATVRASVIHRLTEDGNFISHVEEEQEVTVESAEHLPSGSWRASGDWSAKWTIEYTPPGGSPQL